jgi:hypothetical protein
MSILPGMIGDQVIGEFGSKKSQLKEKPSCG